MLIYNETQLVRELDELPLPRRVAFAGACAERLLPAYATFHAKSKSGDPSFIEQALARLWADLAGDTIVGAALEQLITRCEALVPDEEDDTWIEESAYAQNAAAAVAYALRCRAKGNAQEAGWAARQVYEAIDQYVIRREGIDVNAREAEDGLRGHRLIQAELERQKRDLEDLQSSQANVEEIRQRARLDGQQLFS